MLTGYELFDDMVRFKDVVDTFFYDTQRGRRGGSDYPYVNVQEKDDFIEIKAVVPGVNSEDLTIQLVDDKLVISGERKSDIDPEAHYIRRERSFGTFTKSVHLPYRVDRDKIQASMENGILSVRLEKSEEAKPRKIEIN